MEQLLKVEFPREALAATDEPLRFVINELTAIVERMPRELALMVNTARRITVTIDTD